MTLVISYDKLGNDMSPWEQNGVSEQDYILAEELGLIAQRNQVGDDYEKMIEKRKSGKFGTQIPTQ